MAFAVFPQRVQASLGASDKQARVVAQRHQACHHPLPVTGDTVAVHVADEDDVAERCPASALLAGMLVQASATVDQQDTGEFVFVVVTVQHARQGDVRVLIVHQLIG